MSGPTRKVVGGVWHSVTRFKRGYVNGSRARWTVALECGHEVERWNRGPRLLPPASVRCEKCDAASGAQR